MRRKEKEITDEQRLERIFRKNRSCCLGLTDGRYPYTVPVSYGYKDGCLYFHGAQAGKKNDLIGRNPSAGFCIWNEEALVSADTPCGWGVKFESIVGYGDIEILDDPVDKKTALDIIMEHHGGKGPFEYPAPMLDKTALMVLRIKGFTGKGFKQVL